MCSASRGIAAAHLQRKATLVCLIAPKASKMSALHVSTIRASLAVHRQLSVHLVCAEEPSGAGAEAVRRGTTTEAESSN